jgi:hypothetical protein
LHGFIKVAEALQTEELMAQAVVDSEYIVRTKVFALSIALPHEAHPILILARAKRIAMER